MFKLWSKKIQYFVSPKLDLSSFNSSELLIRFRVITGDGSMGPGWQGDVAIDQVSILSGPVTIDGFFLSDYSNEIINKVKGINRVCYDLTSKPPGTIEFE